MYVCVCVCSVLFKQLGEQKYVCECVKDIRGCIGSYDHSFSLVLSDLHYSEQLHIDSILRSLH